MSNKHNKFSVASAVATFAHGHNGKSLSKDVSDHAPFNRAPNAPNKFSVASAVATFAHGSRRVSTAIAGGGRSGLSYSGLQTKERPPMPKAHDSFIKIKVTTDYPSQPISRGMSERTIRVPGRRMGSGEPHDVPHFAQNLGRRESALRF